MTLKDNERSIYVPANGERVTFTVEIEITDASLANSALTYTLYKALAHHADIGGYIVSVRNNNSKNIVGELE